MKKSRGTPTRIRGHIAPREKPSPGLQRGASRHDRKRSRKWLVLVLLLLFAGMLFFVIRNIPGKKDERRARDALQKEGALIGQRHETHAETKRPAKSTVKVRKNPAADKDAPRRNIRIAIPAEKEENDFGTTLHLDPPPVRN
jgi:hypothetical protein